MTLWIMWYLLLLQLGESLLALNDYTTCLQIHPTNTVALFKCALIYFNRRSVLFNLITF